MLSFIKKIYKSIALLPSVMALCFLALSILLLSFKIDYNQIGFLKSVSITTPKDVQFILAFIIGGIFTLTIFSYTMVMNVLNRNINNYSPRLIPLILSEKHHQLILGFTSGTIIYAMVLSIAIANEATDYFPGIAAPLGVVFAITCVLLFIYFIHSVSQSIHVNYILKAVYNRTSKQLKEFYKHRKHLLVKEPPVLDYSYCLENTPGYLQDLDLEKLGKLANDLEADLFINKLTGDFVLEQDCLVLSSHKIENEQKKFKKKIAVDETVAMGVPETGFKHLVEVAIKASSPALNDPATALSAIDYLTQLFIDRINYGYYNCYSTNEKHHVYFRHITNQDLYDLSFQEMYNFMKDDRKLVDKLEAAGLAINKYVADDLQLMLNYQRKDEVKL